MTEKLTILTYPHEILRVKAEPVGTIDGKLQRFVDCMGEIMYSACGMGLAANQVGKPTRILVYDVAQRNGGRRLSVIINPEITLAEGKIVHEEACLSVIDFSADVTRFEKVKVSGYDRHGKPMDIEAEGILAICLQHEIDHLNGVLYIDYISSLKRTLYKKKLKKILQESQSLSL